MNTMQPRNSFTQIWVVSVNDFVENLSVTQRYVRSVSESNQFANSKVTLSRLSTWVASSSSPYRSQPNG
jgi:hypothetical protein